MAASRRADSMPSDETLRGSLLIASPILRDPNFVRTVIFLCAHDENGALGVVLNRPSPIAVEDVLERWGPIVSEPGSLFNGGPVDLDSAIALGWIHVPDPGDGTLSVVTDPVAMLDLNHEPEEVSEMLSAARIFLGYAGWTAGQLEEELEEDAWLVAESMPTDVFTLRPDLLWQEVLRRQGGTPAMMANFPDDPSLN
jgi:putative transcriptional regulator